MKLTFAPPTDGQVHSYCINCQAETVDQITEDGRIRFSCRSCGQTHPRCLYFDNRKYWLDDQKELWHESSGIFVRNTEGKFLFFDRNMFPTGLTVPAGHVDTGEEPEGSASRELEEEVGIQSKNLRHAVTATIQGDKCSSGADVHVWHVYVESYSGDGKITVIDEGKDPVWLTLEEAKQREMPFAIRYLLDNYAETLQGK